MPTYTNSIYVNLGRKQLKRVFDGSQYPSGYKIRFFIIGSGGLDNNNVPKLVNPVTERLECEGTIMANNITFTYNSNQATGDTTGLAVNNYIRPNFGYDGLISIGYIKWYQITAIVGNTITLDKIYTESNYNGDICFEASRNLYGFIKEIVNTDFTYPDDYTSKVRVFLDYGEGNGDGNQTYSECGLYDIENKLITYANFPQIIKNNAVQLTRYFLLGV